MPNSSNRNTAMRIMVALLATWLVSESEVAAQSTSRALVVVTNRSDGECVKLIGCEHVHVELLFASDSGVRRSNYQACDERVRSLLKFEQLVIRSDEYCPSEAFWCERMAAANPFGKVHRLSQSRCSAAMDCEGRIQRASEIHGLLTSILPDHRRYFDANLKAELRRLRLLQPNALLLVSHD